MSEDAQKLTLALKGDSKTQGDWGEMQLERLLKNQACKKACILLLSRVLERKTAIF